jgi:hypothetical protein
VTLPNGATFTMATDFFPVDWNLDFSQDKIASRLWYRSLAYLPSLLNVEDGWQLIDQVLSDFLVFMQKGAVEFSVIKMSSLDHALAIQLRVCCELYSRADVQSPQRDGTKGVIKEVLPLLMQFARQPGMRLDNNHGIMLSMALLQAAVAFPDIVPIDEARSDAIIGVEQLEAIFDEDGLSYENTPTYQGLYVRLLRDFAELSAMTPRLSEESARFAEVHARASTAYRRLLLPTGHVPPIGDGGLGMERELTPLPGKFVSTANGIYIHSNDHSYLAIICGARSPIHKQMDDTSVLMTHNGKFAILDAGVYNYDPSNAVGAAIRTQRGHSGLFFPKFDEQPLKYFNFGGAPRRVSADMEFANAGGIDQIICQYTLDDHRARREVLAHSPTSLSLTDRSWSPDGSPAVARFLIPESMELACGNGVAGGNDGNIWVRLKAKRDARFKIKRGTISWNLKQRDSCWVVEIEVPAGGDPTQIDIEVGSVED